MKASDCRDVSCALSNCITAAPTVRTRLEARQTEGKGRFGRLLLLSIIVGVARLGYVCTVVSAQGGIV